MVKFVARDEVGKRKNRDRVAVRDAAPQPGFFIQRAKQGQAGLAPIGIFLNKSRELARSKSGPANVIVRFKSLEWRLVSARNTHRAIRENSFRVGNVAGDFFYCPLVRRVAEIAVALAPARQ